MLHHPSRKGTGMTEVSDRCAATVYDCVAGGVRRLHRADESVWRPGCAAPLSAAVAGIDISPRNPVLEWLTDIISPLTSCLFGSEMNRPIEDHRRAAGLWVIEIARRGIITPAGPVTA